ncbi:MAG: DUF4386 domain-containing protein [Ardenticatenales bacterium]
MTTTDPTAPLQRAPMTSLRRTALVAGAFYVLTFVSIPTLALYGPVHNANYIVGSGPDTGVFIGGILEIIVALAGIGTAVTLFPVLKRQNEGFALGLVCSRTLEAALIFAGVASLLTIVTLRQAGAGADALAAGRALAGLYDRTFFVSQSLIPAVNGLLLGTLMYRSRLVPRVLPVLGLIGAVVLLTSDAAILFGVWPAVSAQAGLGALPIAAWEFSLGVYLLVKGFRAAPVTEGMPTP